MMMTTNREKIDRVVRKFERASSRYRKTGDDDDARAMVKAFMRFRSMHMPEPIRTTIISSGMVDTEMRIPVPTRDGYGRMSRIYRIQNQVRNIREIQRIRGAEDEPPKVRETTREADQSIAMQSHARLAKETMQDEWTMFWAMFCMRC